MEYISFFFFLFFFGCGLDVRWAFYLFSFTVFKNLHMKNGGEKIIN
jgi:hypothetical protein